MNDDNIDPKEIEDDGVTDIDLGDDELELPGEDDFFDGEDFDEEEEDFAGLDGSEY